MDDRIHALQKPRAVACHNQIARNRHDLFRSGRDGYSVKGTDLGDRRVRCQQLHNPLAQKPACPCDRNMHQTCTSLSRSGMVSLPVSATA